MASYARLGKILLGLVVSAGLLIYFFWDVDLGVVGARLRETLWGFLALSVALNFLSLWVRPRRWRSLFAPGAPAGTPFRALLAPYLPINLPPLRAHATLRTPVAP